MPLGTPLCEQALLHLRIRDPEPPDGLFDVRLLVRCIEGSRREQRVRDWSARRACNAPQKLRTKQFGNDAGDGTKFGKQGGRLGWRPSLSIFALRLGADGSETIGLLFDPLGTI